MRSSFLLAGNILFHHLLRGRHRPLLASCKLTFRCNLRCQQCPFPGFTAANLDETEVVRRDVIIGGPGLKGAAGSFELPAIKEKVTKAYLLADPQKKALAAKQTGQKWSIALPAAAPDKMDSVLVLETK